MASVRPIDLHIHSSVHSFSLSLHKDVLSRDYGWALGTEKIPALVEFMFW